MKLKKTIIASLTALAVTGILAGCGSTDKKSAPAAGEAGKTTTIRVGVSPVPHAEILNAVKDQLAKDGVNVEIVEFTDYVQPNLALNDKHLDANYFQHKPYLDEFARSRGLKIVSAGAVHLEPMSIFSSKIKDIKALPDHARVAIPNDPTNGGRALLVLQSAGLIKLRDGAPITATPQDIVSNPKDLQFSEDTDIAVININFALEANLHPKDALFIESSDSPYANIIAVREGDEKRPEIQKLMKALTSQECKDFIDKKYNGAIKAAF